MHLNPPVFLDTPNGPAMAHLVIDYGRNREVLFVCSNNIGECWIAPNREVTIRRIGAMTSAGADLDGATP